MQAQSPPVRAPVGVKRERFLLILAVLAKHARMKMWAVDVHINVVGGLMISEPATDLAVALAIASSYYDKPIARDVAVMGEIGKGLWHQTAGFKKMAILVYLSLCGAQNKRS